MVKRVSELLSVGDNKLWNWNSHLHGLDSRGMPPFRTPCCLPYIMQGLALYSHMQVEVRNSYTREVREFYGDEQDEDSVLSFLSESLLHLIHCDPLT